MKNDYTQEVTEVILFDRLSSTKGKVGIIRVAANAVGHFVAVSTSPTEASNAAKIQLNKYSGKFPVTLSYDATEQKEDGGNTSGLVSLDEEILSADTPLTIYGACTYQATFTSVHYRDPGNAPFQSYQMIPDYCEEEANVTSSSARVRAATPIPIRLTDVEDFHKPRQWVHTLTEDQFQRLLSRMELVDVLPPSVPPPPVLHERKVQSPAKHQNRNAQQQEHRSRLLTYPLEEHSRVVKTPPRPPVSSESR